MLDLYNQFKEFKAFEVAFFNEKRELQKLLCNVRSIENNRVIISASNQKNKNIFAEVGNELQLHIYTESGIYSAQSKVLQVTKGMINTEYVIAYPANSKHSQRREYFRAEIPVTFKLTITPLKSNKEPYVISSKARNVCGKGLSYISPTPFLDYKSITVEIFFDEKTVKSEAELVYTQPVQINGKDCFINAFYLTDIAKKDIEFIVKKCFLHQLNLKKKPTY